MATIQINAVNPAGSNLFVDNESYLKELTDTEMSQNVGGSITVGTIFISYMIGYAASKLN